jgi:hypothetical protein
LEPNALLAVFLNTVFNDKTNTKVLISGVGLDDSFLDLSRKKQIESVLLIEIDKTGMKHCWSKRTEQKDMGDYDSREGTFKVTNTINFVLNKKDRPYVLNHRKFDLILDKSFLAFCKRTNNMKFGGSL